MRSLRVRVAAKANGLYEWRLAAATRLRRAILVVVQESTTFHIEHRHLSTQEKSPWLKL